MKLIQKSKQRQNHVQTTVENEIRKVKKTSTQLQLKKQKHRRELFYEPRSDYYENGHISEKCSGLSEIKWSNRKKKDASAYYRGIDRKII